MADNLEEALAASVAWFDQRKRNEAAKRRADAIAAVRAELADIEAHCGRVRTLLGVLEDGKPGATISKLNNNTKEPR
jgi:hypothetical protein